MLELTDVSRSFQNGDQTLHVLQSLSWTIKEGDSVALMGRSGSGKSTLLNLLGCLDQGYSGTIRIADTDLKKMSDKQLAQFRNQTIGMVFQSFHLMDKLSCLDNILLPTWFHPDKQVAAKRGEELLERVGLKDKRNQRPNHLSGGEKQRIAIARALIMEPRLLLCDEPTGNLDEDTREDILTLFQELHKESGITMVLVTHEQQTADIADKIYRLQQGTLHEQSGNSESEKKQETN